MFILDGGVDAELPGGSKGPVIAGPEAIFVAGRVAADAPTLVRIGSPGSEGELVRAHAGDLATPDRVLRIEIFLTDLQEPDEIFVALGSR
jgi:hypothetical protein